MLLGSCASGMAVSHCNCLRAALCHFYSPGNVRWVLTGVVGCVTLGSCNNSGLLLAVRRGDGVPAHVDGDRGAQLRALQGGARPEGGRGAAQRQALHALPHALVRPVQAHRLWNGIGSSGLILVPSCACHRCMCLIERMHPSHNTHAADMLAPLSSPGTYLAQWESQVLKMIATCQRA